MTDAKQCCKYMEKYSNILTCTHPEIHLKSSLSIKCYLCTDFYIWRWWVFKKFNLSTIIRCIVCIFILRFSPKSDKTKSVQDLPCTLIITSKLTEN